MAQMIKENEDSKKIKRLVSTRYIHKLSKRGKYTSTETVV